MVVGSTPALAADRCRTAAHAYLTQPGRVYFSGYDGVGQFGIPTINAVRGDTLRLGGNGILPGTTIRFQAVDMATGVQVDVIPGSRLYTTQGARNNCVVHEEGPYTITALPGRYRITAIYRPGNLSTGSNDLVDQVAELQVSR
jgi:hypothetical protein